MLICMQQYSPLMMIYIFIAVEIFSWDLKKYTIVRKDVIIWKIHIAMSVHW